MHPTHAPWVRGFLERKFTAVRLWMSTVRDPPELEAIRALSDPVIVTEIIDFVMAKLGHGCDPIRGDSMRAAADKSPGRSPDRVLALRRKLKGPRGMEHEEAEV